MDHHALPAELELARDAAVHHAESQLTMIADVHTSPTSAPRAPTARKDGEPLPAWSQMSRADRLAYVKTEVLLGVVISFAQVPESVSFAFLAHVRPAVALHSAWIVGLVCALFGGRPGMIHGASGAFAAVIATFLSKPNALGESGDGVELLFPSVMLAGVLMGLVWLGGGARFVTMIGEPVMVGFCNGLAIVIFLAQLHPFRAHDEAGRATWKGGVELGLMLAIMTVSMLTMEFVPKIPRAWAKMLPSSLLAIVIASALELLIRAHGLRTDTIGDVARLSDESRFPIPFFLDARYDLAVLRRPGAALQIVKQACILCLVGVVESLMTTEVVTELVKTPANQHAVISAMGAANCIAGFLGGMGGNAMIALSQINGLSGGKGRLAPATTALCVMGCVMGAYPLLNHVPISALTGVMLVVVVHTFRWSSLGYFVAALVPTAEQRARCRLGRLRLPVACDRWDALVAALVTAVTVACNLMYAVVLGVVLTAVRFAWDASHRLHVSREPSADGRSVTYTARDGHLFFGNALRFGRWFDFDADPQRVELRIEHDASDLSAQTALKKLRGEYEARGKTLHVVVRRALKPATSPSCASPSSSRGGSGSSFGTARSASAAPVVSAPPAPADATVEPEPGTPARDSAV
ncbi:hypothetical protein KFE25_006447 [Diacronema lutheri]|uniref:SLC26A/SulP transporter domain-containing protein n=1 Tax=Diacronema lutheri TaxID=2081491 RepID=A0A8J5XWL4_DIALT|nr:hypothetical protein KFE25_006447 [Diacronema lutheri]